MHLYEDERGSGHDEDDPDVADIPRHGHPRQRPRFPVSESTKRQRARARADLLNRYDETLKPSNIYFNTLDYI